MFADGRQVHITPMTGSRRLSITRDVDTILAHHPNSCEDDAPSCSAESQQKEQEEGLDEGQDREENNLDHEVTYER